MRQPTLYDGLLSRVDEALRVVAAPPPGGTAPSPAGDLPDVEFNDQQRRHAAGLMRINHTGEVCAQALYAGQAATARTSKVRTEMKQAALEEVDHLAWCAERLEELGSRPSLLNPFWYAGSFSIGAAAGLAGDPWSLGFVEATERQVEAHLNDHLDTLPPGDERSRAIVRQMAEDEARHADMAVEHGAQTIPAPIQTLMGVTANIMKAIVYRV
ncbi:MAG: 2-polyprenyl-3-methyl-6-methoxy-1,4-benzoquinone monooxygenase [Wenzhouxiangella sp.]|jgi:ubiquinone biosynthesis monooxygenase Coq7|nr:2-polyprenyl-3-methyl-6-methoxy-1,4-benzoquinone monooxygenase [Wenzhouxiangella sp.]